MWSRVAVPLLVGGLFPARILAAAETAPPELAPRPVAPKPPPAAGGPSSSRLIITSDSNCPSGPAVAAALATLNQPGEGPSGTVLIQATDETLVVELVSDGSTRRQLRVTDDCAVRAMTVALVIATWTGELASDAAGTPVLRDQVPLGEEAARVPAPPAALTPPGGAPITERELGAGLLLAVTEGIAPGMCIDFVQTRAARGLGWQAGLALPARRERAAGGTTASWTRASASIALNARTTLRRLALSAAAGLAGAYTITSGHGYAVDQGAQALTGGFVVAARLALPWRSLRVWTEVRAYKWLFPQSVAVDSTAGDHVAKVTLPSFDVHWALGLAYLFR
jgi:hypothetical protein